ncbi:hypothetical protein PENFLA_c011G07762 [Penicillium flavigenum]|uniref:Uncharacterized protein n=1 Tax=Penicillium flavigenum TaxID=254877 RepID=A0A1V6TBT5_9EURO|nr:hypothetical protein PENFLA_c011G07762 [Penicillium flavigenum]
MSQSIAITIPEQLHTSSWASDDFA